VADRRNWTQADLVDVQKALATTSTAKIARRLNVKVKSLRSALRRHGISIRFVRRGDRPRKSLAGVRVQRPASGVAATYGAAALVALPDRACHWPLGDPAEPGFQFCGTPRASLMTSYCPNHEAQAHLPAHTRN
jgi:GcrA cell cycle regulator